jgi:sideroflexin-5
MHMLIQFHRTLLTSSSGLEHAKALLVKYKQGAIQQMNPELWQAKKIVDSTLHPGLQCSALCGGRH